VFQNRVFQNRMFQNRMFQNRLFQNRVPRKILVPKTDEVPGWCRKTATEQFTDLCRSPSISPVI
jgi:hypothetical protein